jgi:hypothetical protein
MGDRPNAKPLATNEDDDDSVQPVMPILDLAVTDVAHSMANDPDSDSSVGKLTPPSSASVCSSKRRISASDAKVKKGKSSVDDILATYLGDDENGEQSHNNSFRQLRVREVEARETEAKARMLEAEAVNDKAKLESELLRVKASAELLCQRKQLANEGVEQEDIDVGENTKDTVSTC